MDFKISHTTPEGLGALAADALLLVLVGTEAPQGLPPALAPVLKSALDAGDLALKAGQMSGVDSHAA